MSNLKQSKRQRRYQSLGKEDDNNGNTLLNNDVNSFKLSRNSKSGPSHWKMNNSQLAKENARLRKDVQKLIAALNESTARCENLETAFRRRGETLSKIDIMSRLLGNQIRDFVDTLTELRTACQVELSSPLQKPLTEPLNISHPVSTRTIKSTLQNRSHLVNHVNPMVSGHPIIKPTITLKRLNLRNVPSNVPEEQVQVQSRTLNEVEIPLQRLSLSQIAESIGSPLNRVSQLETEGDDTIFESGEMHSSISLSTIFEESSENCSPRNRATGGGSLRTTSPLIDSTNSQWSTASPDGKRSVSNRQSNSSSRKYTSTFHVSTPISGDQRNQIHGNVEKCCLVVALKDVGSYLRNGTLTNVELFEERKVKTGASAHSDSKVGGGNIDPQLNISSASGEDQAEVNFTTESDSMSYGAFPVHGGNEEENSFSATQEFLNRIKSEDPLEGPSWRYENITTRKVRKRYRPHSENASLYTKKNKQDDSTIISKKANSLDSSQLYDSKSDEHSQVGPQTSFNNSQSNNLPKLDFTECVVAAEERSDTVPDTYATEEKTEFSISDVPILQKDSLKYSLNDSSCTLTIEENISPQKTECSAELQATPKRGRPKKSASKSEVTNIGQHKSSSIKKRKKQKKIISKSYSEGGKGMKKLKKHLEKINKNSTEIETVPLEVGNLETGRSESLNGEHPRARRAVAPKCLKEPLLNNKLRRE